MKNKRWFLALIWLTVLPILACQTLSGGGDATEEPAATLAAVTVEVATLAPPTEPPPTATSDPAAGFVPYDNADTGLALRYPADWFIDDILFVTIASNEELATGDAADIVEGAVMILIPGSTEELGGTDPVALLTTAADEFAVGGDQQLTSGPVATTIQGQPAAVGTVSATSDSGLELEGQIAIIVNGDWAAIAFGVTPAAAPNTEQYLATLDAIFQTIVVSEPTASNVELPPVVTELVPATVGGRYEDTVPENGSFDYALGLVRGEPVTIAADPEDDLDLVLEVFGAEDLNVPLRSVDDAFSGETEEIIFAAPADGEYIIRVRGFAGSGGGYALTITAGGAVSQGEGLIPMTLQTAYNDELTGEPAGYLLSLTTDQPIPIILVPETEDQDLLLEIYDMFGNQLIRIDDGFSGDPEGAVFVPESDGDYEVRVSAFGLNEDGYLLMAFDPDLAFQSEGEVARDSETNYRMCVPAGASMVAVATPEEGFDLTVTVLGPGGGTLTDEVDNAISGEAETVYYADGAGSADPYPVIVSVAGWADGSGRFTILITSTGDTPVVQDGC